MPYYSSYGSFLAGSIYWMVLIPVMVLSLWAWAQVSGNFNRYSQVSSRRRLTGAQAADAALRVHGAGHTVGYAPIRLRRGGRR